MYAGKMVFAQIMEHLPWKTFHRIVNRHQGDHRARTLNCAEHFRILAFAQLTYRESLRDIEACLGAQSAKLYHLGIRDAVSRSTLADANEARPWQIYSDFAHVLIAQARKLYAKDHFGIDLDNTVYALDSTTIDLCLSMFPWAPFRSTKAAVKLHTLLDLCGNISSFIHVSDGKLHDVNALDFSRLYTLHSAGSFFVTRAKVNLSARRVYSTTSDRSIGIICDQIISLNGITAKKDYPEKLRRVRFKDSETKKTYIFLTNNMTLPASTICALYKSRWQVELFFKWIKQHLRIKKFYGTSENAVKSQIWIAVSVYVLVAIIKKKLATDASLYTLLQIFSLTLFEKTLLIQLIPDVDYKKPLNKNDNQLNLFEFLTGH
jgi:hypothetical protein